jgi:tetratricopeptide (TPR) repeat protein
MTIVPSIRSHVSARRLGALACVLFAVSLPAQTVESATQALLEKAHTFEVRGRMDMAAQTWQQVLLVDPNNVDALAGLARSANSSRNPALAKVYLDRLRAIHPTDRNIGHVEGTGSQASQTAQLQQANRYAQSGQYAQAMQIYRQVFGETPPPGESALAYYQTESATEVGRPHAIAGLRALVQRYPTDPRYQIALGRALTYNPQTRAEGRRYLERYPTDPQAVESLRQSLAWDSANPASAADIRTYLGKHNDAQLAQALRNQPKPTTTRASQSPAEITATPSRNLEEQRAYSALNAKNLPEAELLFKAILARDPQNARALAGMGYVRIQQANYDGAISFFAQARQNGARDSVLDAALESARFSALMDQGSAALAANDLPTAEKRYRSALATRPVDPEALSGLGETLLKARQPEAAIAIYERYVQAKPTAADAWRGLFAAQVDAGHAAQALQTLNRIPPAVRAQLALDPGFQIAVAAMYQSQNKLDIAQEILEKSVAQQTSAGQKPSTAVLLQLAGIYLARNQPQQAFPIYRRILSENADRPDAWKGLLTALHATGRDGEGLAQIQQIPLSVRRQLENDLEYLQAVAAIYNALGQPREALVFLSRVQEHYAAAHTAAPADIDIQVARLLVNSDNDTDLDHQLLLLGDRHDLSDEQRRTIQMIWTDWAIRRASQWAAAGNVGSSLVILNATARSFPDNPAAPRALADGYFRAGLPKHAVLIFKSQNMATGSVPDYESAVGAALAARDNRDAETWMQSGLAAYPKDAEMLGLAAKYEQARGNKKRAADYYRASLAALPPVDPGVALANKLSQPLPVVPQPSHKRPRDLATLLDNIDAPQVAPQSKPDPLFLPSYSNVYGNAPVQVPLQPSGANVVPPFMTNPDSHANLQAQTGGSQTATQQDTYGSYIPYVQSSQPAVHTPSAVPVPPERQ